MNLDSLELEPDPIENLAIEPEPPVQPVIEVQLEPSAAPLAQLLPADFPLPLLIRFVPSPAIKSELATAVAYAAGLEITEKGVDGLRAADLALDALNAVIKKTTQHFAEPADIANRLHKSITGVRAEWCDPAEAAKKALGTRMYSEKSRLDKIAAEERRKAQDEADRLARAEAQRQADEAAKKKAPAAVVEKLQEQAKTATAPPVPIAPAPAAVMKSSTTVTTWKARLKGTLGDEDPNPSIENIPSSQWEQIAQLLRDIADGTMPRAAVSLNWSYLNTRAKSDKSTLTITGIEAFAEGNVRAKSSRGR